MLLFRYFFILILIVIMMIVKFVKTLTTDTAHI